MKKQNSAYWEKIRERRAIALFHETARHVPAYKDFLQKHHVNPSKIRTFKDFQLVPPVSKKNYLKQYPLHELAWNGTLGSPLVWTATSGSTGQPFYFPRNHALDEQYSLILESFLENGLRGDDNSTLVIVGFGMGVWIGGLITYSAYEIAARRRNYPLSIITPGINKKEIFNALRELAPRFSQTILVGYPPFIKDLLDEAKDQKIDVKKLNLRLHFAAEAFTENFRDYLGDEGHLRNIYLDTMNIYGSADIGAMAFETPFSILVRRLAIAEKSKQLFGSIFPNASKTPTLAQYHPSAITFEAPEGEILLSGNSAIPLVRYAIGDHGGTMSFDEVEKKFSNSGTSLRGAIIRHGLKKHVSELPLVFVYERIDFSTTLYGLQIYPEHLREALIQPAAKKFVTGKLMMETKFSKKHDQYLDVNLEMRPHARITKKAKDAVLKVIVDNLDKVNSEFRELHRFLGKRALPHLTFWPAEDAKYFRPGIKQKWVQSQ
jgi:phenylacetate-CoA ligase